jgi:hypothetical protein
MRCTQLQICAATATISLLAGAAAAQPDVPAVTRPITVMVGDARAELITTPVTYFGGSKQGDFVTRIGTLFASMSQGDAYSRAVSVERGSCTDPLLAPVITLQPSTIGICAIATGGDLSIESVGTGRITYLWELEAEPGLWLPLHQAPLELACGGSARLADASTHRIVVIPCGEQAAYRVRCTVANSCGGVTSSPVSLRMAVDDAWSWRSIATGPSPRLFSAVAKDSRRGRVVVHGGTLAPGISDNQTWEFDGAAWTQLATGGPGDVHAAGMADLGDGRVLLFGGYSFTSGSFSSITWVWNGSTWSQVAGPGPSARFLVAMANDPIRRRVVMFGGTNSPVADLDDTWEFNPATNQWTQIAIAGPSPRSGCQLAHDPLTGHMVLFAGSGLDGRINADGTWIYNGAQWRRAAQRNSIEPLSRANYAFSTDTGRQRLVLHGGRGRHPVPIMTNFGDAWEWDGIQEQWTQIPPSPSAPPVLYGCSGVESPTGDPLVLFGSSPPIVNGAHAFSGPGRATIVRQPAIEPAEGAALLHLGVLGSGIVTYQWFRDGAPLNFEAYPTSRRATLRIEAPSPADVGTYHCVVSDACGEVESVGIYFDVAPPCFADFNQDGGIDGNDIDAFFIAWESGDSLADVNQDGGVDGSDVSVFFAAWENGGC